MGRASSNKRVARAARAAGRDPGPKRSRALAWPLAMVAVVGLGFALVVFSRGDRAVAAAPILGDHWHAAYGISVCGEFLPNLGDAKEDVSGIHTHADGLIHMHPFSTRYTGEMATLGAWADQVNMILEDDLLDPPGPGDFRSGGNCGEEPAEVQVKVWTGGGDDVGRLLEADIADFAPPNGSLITIAFAPVGADLPKPPSAGTVPDDLPGAAPVGGEPTPGATTPGATTPATDPIEGSTTTVAGDPAASSTSVPDATSTTSVG